jgi:hypothetical protein
MYWTLGCDADDPQMIAEFWALALGYVKEPGFDEPDSASIIDPDGDRLRSEVARLASIGATVVREEFYDEHLGHVVMLDPEGNEFCVA